MGDARQVLSIGELWRKDSQCRQMVEQCAPHPEPLVPCY